MAKFIAFILGLLFVSGAMNAQPGRKDTLRTPDASEKIDPERPDQSESADLVDPRIFQAEFGFNRENSNGPDYDLLYPTALFKYGLKNFELRMETVIRSSYQQLIPNPKWTTGLDPVILGFKIPLIRERKFIPKTSLISSFAIPGLASKAFRTDHVAPSIKLVMLNTLSRHADLSYNIGVEWDGFSKIPDWLYSISQSFDLGESWNVYAEIFGFFRKNEASRHSFDAGIGYCISNNTKVDLSGGISISNADPKNYIALGFSFRIKTGKKNKD